MGGYYKSDINSLISPGIFWCTQTETTNKPINLPGTIINNSSSSDHITQIFVTNNNFVFIRAKSNGVWQKWEQLISNNDLKVVTYDLQRPSNSTSISYGDICNIYLRKSGYIVTISINIEGSITAVKEWNEIITLPSEYRPAVELVQNFVTQDGKTMLITITMGGIIKIFNVEGEAINNTWICRQTITYVTNNH